MTEEEHRQIVAARERGELLIGVHVHVAREFFTDTHHAAVAREIGEAIYVEKAVVYGSAMGSPIALLASLVFGVLWLKWWAALLLPVMAMVWFVHQGYASCGFRTLGSTVLLVAGCLVGAYLAHPHTTFGALALGSLGLSLLLGRLMYLAAVFMLRCLVIRNHKAFSLLAGHAIFVTYVRRERP